MLGAAGAQTHWNISQMPDFTRDGGARSAAPIAFAQAGVTPADIDTIQFYDSFTITVLLLLEDLGFCPKGEGGKFVAGGPPAPGRRRCRSTPTAAACRRATPACAGSSCSIEAVRQLRGQAGEAQVPDCELALACGSGGWLSVHRHRDPREGAPVSDRDAERPSTSGRGRCRAARRGVSAVLGGRRRAGELLIQECPSCGHRQFYPRAVCTACGGDAELADAARARGPCTPSPSSARTTPSRSSDELPYVVAMVELDEGPRMMGNVTGVDADDVHIGMPVEVYFVQADEGVGVPFFRPRSA